MSPVFNPNSAYRSGLISTFKPTPNSAAERNTFATEPAELIRSTRAFKLAQGDEPDRWGIGLKGEAEAQSVAVPVLAKAIGVAAEDVAAWCDIAKPVPPASQKALALYLHADRSRLFTDLEPARA